MFGLYFCQFVFLKSVNIRSCPADFLLSCKRFNDMKLKS
jgi:hypothetical protein